jgi:bifunctional UDP-N-acetylglucosamine pyrophosphorylase/glucosamine-1-phosphate N-acetyltransferase
MTDLSAWVAIIMAAGQGTRMRSRLPKVAHPLAGRPIVRHVVEAARGAGIDNCVVVVGAGEDADSVRAAAGNDVRFATQAEQLGTGHAVECARGAAGDAEFVLILNGDVPLVLPETLRRLAAAVAGGAVDLALLTALVPVEAYGVLDLAPDMRVAAITETKAAEGIERDGLRYINAGQYAVRASWLWSRLDRIGPAANGERYLTALAAIAHAEGNSAVAIAADDPAEVRGINDRVQLAEAEASMRDRIRRAHMLAGVTIIDPASTFIDAGVEIGSDTVIEPNTHLRGATLIGEACTIGPSTIVEGSTIGARCVVRQSTIESSVLDDGVDMGPYSHLRPGTRLGAGVHIGNFAEVKASRLGARTKMGHFSYIGDADVGEDVNIGAGTITANYDGTSKHRTVIGDRAFIGSDTMLVAPVTIGCDARTSAGAVVTKDVPDAMIAIGAPARLRSSAAPEEMEHETGR